MVLAGRRLRQVDLVAHARRAGGGCDGRSDRYREVLGRAARSRHRDGVPELRLYPHYTVAKNLAYGLRCGILRRRIELRFADVSDARARRALQRLPWRCPVATAARGDGGYRREPAAFLMDEPLSNLDAKLRVDMRAELARLHERLGITTVYVTHDQVEAMTLGTRVAVMRAGTVQQVDTPQTLYRSPANLFVAAFIGSPSMNLVEAELDTTRWRSPDSASRWPTTDALPAVRPGASRRHSPPGPERGHLEQRSLPTIDVEVRCRRGAGFGDRTCSSRSTRRPSTSTPCALRREGERATLLANRPPALFTAEVSGGCASARASGSHSRSIRSGSISSTSRRASRFSGRRWPRRRSDVTDPGWEERLAGLGVGRRAVRRRASRADRGPRRGAARRSVVGLFERAGSFDSTRPVRPAVPLYREALEAVLDGERRRRAVVQIARLAPERRPGRRERRAARSGARRRVRPSRRRRPRFLSPLRSPMRAASVKPSRTR